jgi:hypothetical protein
LQLQLVEQTQFCKEQENQIATLQQLLTESRQQRQPPKQTTAAPAEHRHHVDEPSRPDEGRPPDARKLVFDAPSPAPQPDSRVLSSSAVAVAPTPAPQATLVPVSAQPADSKVPSSASATPSAKSNGEASNALLERLLAGSHNYQPVEVPITPEHVEQVSTRSQDIADTIDDYDIASVRDKLALALSELEDAREQLNLQNEQLTLLKDTIRELERQIERTKTLGTGAPVAEAITSPEASKPAVNIQYLKNTIVSYMCSRHLEERKRMVPVVALLLHLSPEETQKITQQLEAESTKSDGLLLSAFSLFK